MRHEKEAKRHAHEAERARYHGDRVMWRFHLRQRDWHHAQARRTA